MIFIKIKKIRYCKPEKNNLCLIYQYSHGQRIDLVVKKSAKKSNICNYRRVKGNKVINSVTGEVKEYQPRILQDPKEVFKKLKSTTYTITENWLGRNWEKLIKLYYDTPSPPQQMSKHFESFVRKLTRKLGQELKYVNVLLFSTDNIPQYELWISSMNNEEIIISQRELQSIWSYGDVSIIEITEENLHQLADYYIPKNHNCRLDVYPANIRVYRCSRKRLKEN